MLNRKVLVGHITFHLSQEYSMMVLQSIEQACRQLGLQFSSSLATSDAEWIQQTQSMIAAGAKAIIYNCPSVSIIPSWQKYVTIIRCLATYFGLTAETFLVILDHTGLLTIHPCLMNKLSSLVLLFQKMRDNGKTNSSTYKPALPMQPFQLLSSI